MGEAYFHMLNNVAWAREGVIQEGPTDVLDHTSYRFAFGGKIGPDATAKGPEAFFRLMPGVGMDDGEKREVLIIVRGEERL